MTSPIPIHLFTVDDYEKWHKKQSAFVQNMLETQAFTATAGNFTSLPDETGALASVIVIRDDTPHMWDIAELATALPHNMYALSDDHTLTDEQLHAACVGWHLAQYRFDDYLTKESAPLPTLHLPKP